MTTSDYWYLLVSTGDYWYLMVSTGDNWYLLVSTSVEGCGCGYHGVFSDDS